MAPKTLKIKRSKKAPDGSSAEDLRLAAYFRWLSRGCPPGDDLADWVAVEQEFAEEAKSRSTHDI